MTREEAVNLLRVRRSAYGQRAAEPEDPRQAAQMAAVWASVLGDISYGEALDALKAHIATSPFPPAVSEIRAGALTLRYPGLSLTGEEAWALTYRAAARYGRSGKAEGLLSLPPQLRDYAGRRWQEICLSTEPERTGRRFAEGWTGARERELKRAVLPPAERERLALPGLPCLLAPGEPAGEDGLQTFAGALCAAAPGDTARGETPRGTDKEEGGPAGGCETICVSGTESAYDPAEPAPSFLPYSAGGNAAAPRAPVLTGGRGRTLQDPRGQTAGASPEGAARFLAALQARRQAQAAAKLTGAAREAQEGEAQEGEAREVSQAAEVQEAREVSQEAQAQEVLQDAGAQTARKSEARGAVPQAAQDAPPPRGTSGEEAREAVPAISGV